MPKPIKKRAAAPQAGTEDVKDTLAKFAAAAGERKKHLTIAGIAILAVLLIASGAYLFKRNASERAAFLEAEGYKMFNAMYETASMPAAERLEQALKNFRDADATAPSAFRHYYVAATLAELGRSEEAIKALEEVESMYSSNMTILPVAKLKKAQLLRDTGQKDKALAAYQEYSFLSVRTLKDFAIMQTAELLEEMDRHDEAQQYYSQLIKEYPESQLASIASAFVEQPVAGSVPGPAIINSGALSVEPIK